MSHYFSFTLYTLCSSIVLTLNKRNDFYSLLSNRFLKSSAISQRLCLRQRTVSFLSVDSIWKCVFLFQFGFCFFFDIWTVEALNFLFYIDFHLILFSIVLTFRFHGAETTKLCCEFIAKTGNMFGLNVMRAKQNMHKAMQSFISRSLTVQQW